LPGLPSAPARASAQAGAFFLRPVRPSIGAIPWAPIGNLPCFRGRSLAVRVARPRLLLVDCRAGGIVG